VVEAEGAAALRATVGALLSSLEAEVLWAHLEGWSYQELAERLDRSTKSVDNALQRARRKVGGHLAGGSGGRSTLAS
jgi:RNA polymerase sporulation-specific sigma factor